MAFDSGGFCLSVSSEGEDNSHFGGIGKKWGRGPLVVGNWNNNNARMTKKHI